MVTTEHLIIRRNNMIESGVFLDSNNNEILGTSTPIDTDDVKRNDIYGRYKIYGTELMNKMLSVGSNTDLNDIIKMKVVQQMLDPQSQCPPCTCDKPNDEISDLKNQIKDLQGQLIGTQQMISTMSSQQQGMNQQASPSPDQSQQQGQGGDQQQGQQQGQQQQQ